MNTMHVKATYSRHRISRMAGNPLIEALPPERSDEELVKALWHGPDFELEQKSWEDHFRIQQIKSLANMMVPLERHRQLARMLDAMLREGYVGRAPKTKETVQQLQQIYDMQISGQTFSQLASNVTAADTAALIGPSGLGKTTTVRRHLAQYPQIIFHEELNIHQVTYLHIDIPSDGGSVKALAIAIISALDKLLPEHDYSNLYLRSTSRSSTEALIHSVSRLLTIHHVGLLVADEIQNLCNSKKGSQTVMTELVTMCNMLNVPILFIGTNKASQVLTADFRQARRATGVGITPWSKMPRYDYDVQELATDPDALIDASEWAQFIEILWSYQWVRTPVQLTQKILDTLYLRTQGILDLAIKLFATAQVRAILTGSETLSVELIEQVYEEDFKLLHEAVEALARNDYAALARYADVAPSNLEDILTGLSNRANRRRLNNLVKREQPGFTNQIALAAMAAGVTEEQATVLADEIRAEGIAQDSADGLKELNKKLKPSPIRTPSKSQKSKPIEWPDFSEQPNDYRRALQLAEEVGVSVFSQMQSLGFAQDVEDLIPLD